ncbi:MAG: hypothetical protein JHC19_02480 [Desulfurococcaceae archaeon]|nr:hypothetical protein [Desulfurococcaceae archaeon]
MSIFDKIIIISLSFVLTFVTAYIIMRISFSKGLVGKDVHKAWESYASDIGGVSLILGSLIPLVFELNKVIIGFFITSLIALLIGLIDDLYVLSAKLKTLLSATTSLPVILLELYTPTPYIPLIGEARLYILYPLAIMVGFAVALNAVNMSDTHNGLVSGILFMSLSALYPLISYLDHRGEIMLLSALGSLAAFLIYNIYPAKIFLGNSGSFLLGSWIAYIAFVYRIEFLVILMFLPMVTNGFSILVSIKGLRERREIKKRPVKVVNGFIIANKDDEAPITLVHMASLRKPLRETDLVISIYILYLVSITLGLIIWFLLR